MSKKLPSEPTRPSGGSRRRRRLRSQRPPLLPPLRRSPRFHHHHQQKTASAAAVVDLDTQTLSKTECNEGRKKHKKKLNPVKCSSDSEDVSPACVNRWPSTPIIAPQSRRRSLRLASHYAEQVEKQGEEASFLVSAAVPKAEEEYGKSKRKRTEASVKKPEGLRRSARLASHYAEQVEKQREEASFLVSAAVPKAEEEYGKSKRKRTDASVKKPEGLRRSARLVNHYVEQLDKKEEELSYLESEVTESEEDQRKCTEMAEVRAGEGKDAGEEENEPQLCFTVLGHWTKDEDAALQRAYLMAKPSPHFWKKVSKMVPGKSAQECFDRIHADLATPPQPQPRSRTKKTNISPVNSFCFADDSIDAAKQKVNKARNSKHTIIATHKTVRRLLRKHQLVDQAQEADLFSVLETSPNLLKLSDTSPSHTPDNVLKSSCLLMKCNQKSSSAHKRLMTNQASEPSPEVLKRIKNIPLHEKYIDHLLSRESRRAGLPKKKSSLAVAGTMTNVPNAGAVKAAKASLISEARETIRQFQHLQANILEDDHGSDADMVNDNSDCCEEDDV